MLLFTSICTAALFIFSCPLFRQILKLFESEPVPKRVSSQPAAKSDGKRQASLTSFFGPATRRRRTGESERS